MFHYHDNFSLLTGFLGGIILAPFFYMSVIYLANKLNIIGYAPTKMDIDNGGEEFADTCDETDDPDYWKKGSKKYGDEQI